MSNSRNDRGYIFDTSCLNYFALTANLHLIRNRYAGRAFIPREVQEELHRGVADHPELSQILSASWLQIMDLKELPDLALFAELRNRWGSADRNNGEAALIALAKRHGLIAVIDDRIGRMAAKELGVPRIGTVGIIAGMVQRSELTAAQGWGIHQDMVSAGFRSPIKNKADFVAL